MTDSHILDVAYEKLLAKEWGQMCHYLTMIDISSLSKDSILLYIRLCQEIGQYRSIVDALDILLAREETESPEREHLLLQKARYYCWLEDYSSAEQILHQLPLSSLCVSLRLLLHYLRWDLKGLRHHLSQIRQMNLSLSHEGQLLSELVQYRLDAIAPKSHRLERFLSKFSSVAVRFLPLAPVPIFPETDYPEKTLLLLRKALEKEALGEFTEAEQAYFAVIEISSVHWWVAYRWLRCSSILGRTDLVESVIDRWLQQYQWCHSLYALLAAYYRVRKQYSKALWYALKGLEIAPQSPMLNLEVSRSAFRLGHLSRARHHLQVAAQGCLSYGWSGYYFEMIFSGAIFLSLLTGHVRDAIRYWKILCGK